MRFLLLTFFFLNLFMMEGVVAQSTKENPDRILSELTERSIENEESTTDYSQLEEELRYCLKHKLDLNTVTETELRPLFFLSDAERKAIVEHRIKCGPYISVLELQSVEALSERSACYLLYFVSTDVKENADPTPFNRMVSKGNHALYLLHENEFEHRKGYDPERRLNGTGYTGSPFRYVLKYRFNYSDKLAFGFTGEKDKGEPFMSGEQKAGFDFNSAYFFYKPQRGFISALAVGDYQVNFGQGLTFATGIVAQKTAFVLAANRSYKPLGPYKSVNESGFLRGIAFTSSFHSVEVTSFISARPISTSSVNADSLRDELGTIQLSGLHRTAAEISHLNNAFQWIYGLHAEWRKSVYSIGITGVRTEYNQAFGEKAASYQHYDFRGNDLSQAGINCSVRIRNAVMFGELAISSNGGYAGISSLAIPLDEKLDLLFLYRQYSPDYQKTYTNAFAENSDRRNEEGFYSGMSYKINRKWLLSSYLDFYRSHWLRYQIDAPSGGKDLLGDLHYQMSKNTLIYLRYRCETKNKNEASSSSFMKGITDQCKTQFRVHAQYQITPHLSGKSRLEYCAYQTGNTSSVCGSMIFQDLTLGIPKWRCNLTGRLALFNVEDYSARLYAVESDVLYQYAVPAFQNSGTRAYLVLNYALNRTIECWIKYSITAYSNINTIGSGNDEIRGNKLQELRVQLRVSF